MSPDRALTFNIDPDACRGICESGRYGGAWRVEYQGKVLTMFAADNPWGPGRWIGALRRLRDAA